MNVLMIIYMASVVVLVKAGHIPDAAETVEIIGGNAPMGVPVAPAAPAVPPVAFYPFPLPAGFVPIGSSFSGHRIQHTLTYTAPAQAVAPIVEPVNVAAPVASKFAIPTAIRYQSFN